VELALVWAFLGLRAFVLGQAAVAVAAGSLSRSDSPPLDAALLGAMAVESLLLGRWLARRRSMLPFGWPVVADFGLSVLVLALAAASTLAGFGISEVLGRQLAGMGGTGVVESRPGTGTVVRIMVPLEHS
jgi:hypothetical protein